MNCTAKRQKFLSSFIRSAIFLRYNERNRYSIIFEISPECDNVNIFHVDLSNSSWLLSLLIDVHWWIFIIFFFFIHPTPFVNSLFIFCQGDISIRNQLNDVFIRKSAIGSRHGKKWKPHLKIAWGPPSTFARKGRRYSVFKGAVRSFFIGKDTRYRYLFKYDFKDGIDAHLCPQKKRNLFNFFFLAVDHVRMRNLTENLKIGENGLRPCLL